MAEPCWRSSTPPTSRPEALAGSSCRSICPPRPRPGCRTTAGSRPPRSPDRPHGGHAFTSRCLAAPVDRVVSLDREAPGVAVPFEGVQEGGVVDDSGADPDPVAGSVDVLQVDVGYVLAHRGEATYADGGRGRVAGLVGGIPDHAELGRSARADDLGGLLA